MTRIEIQKAVPPREILETPRATVRIQHERSAGGIDGSFAPSFEIQEHARHFIVRADVPGVAPANLSIFIDHDWLTVCGRRADESPATNYRAYERTFGSFWRAFHLHPGVVGDGARAALERGVLSVFVPKRLVLS